MGRKQSSRQQSVRYYKIHFYLHIYWKIWCIKAFDKNCRNQAHLQTQKKRERKKLFWGDVVTTVEIGRRFDFLGAVQKIFLWADNEITFL